IQPAQARYACDSALKGVLTSLADFQPTVIQRSPNEPDFSDVFAYEEEELQQYLDEMSQFNQELHQERRLADLGQDANDRDLDLGLEDINGVDPALFGPDEPQIRGPYGPAWPLAQELIEMEVGGAQVRIEIHDENAKYPLAWMLMEDEEIEEELEVGFESFCEWMKFSREEIETLREQVAQVGAIKTFTLEFSPQVQPGAAAAPRTGRSRTRTTTRGRRGLTAGTQRKPPTPAELKERQDVDLTRLLHSGIIDLELLARPTLVSDTRQESALKYIGLSTAAKINVNTAPRHVLESAFAFGGDAREIADEIITRRQVVPFANMEDLKRDFMQYADSLNKCEKYITTASTLFTVRVTATLGVAQVSKWAVVTKSDKGLKKVAVLSGR
ncbi:MAG: general secretion pathway protein GspK, partial [Planctomycetes bacterium]|nr:general secretion pathway protein GspK [Planctomycetota bacterium]